MLLEETTEYAERVVEQTANPSYIQTGSDIADYMAMILRGEA